LVQTIPTGPRYPWPFGSGPAVADAFVRALALNALIAWLSLGVQLPVLLGSHGLLPVADFVATVRAQPGVSLLDLPTLFWWGQSDTLLRAGVVLGAVVSLAALAGYRHRLCFALSTVLYLSYATVARDFLSFQWDNLLLECTLLAACLPTYRPAPLAHFLFRLVLFKLYFESGIAKWQSPLRDWHDGSAMTYYYETAPLPTWVAFYAHHLPAWWHHLESRVTLALELIVPFAIFGPRRARLFAAVAFTLFQLVNVVTANYGFFCYLALALHLFLLDDLDLERARRWVALRLPRVWRWAAALARLTRRRLTPANATATPTAAKRWLAWAAATTFMLVSAAEATLHFAQPGALVALTRPLLSLNDSFRLVGTYHLFASITRERIEPEFQTADATTSDETGWTPQHLRHKPGDVARRPDFVAPHQPRVDFQLWFYGLRYERREPLYVATLIERLCEDPRRVQPLFRAPLPSQPAAVRIVYWRYEFASAAERADSGAWWRRTRLAASRAVPCNDSLQNPQTGSEPPATGSDEASSSSPNAIANATPTQ
jgi:uncharacterized membrane protein YphA (DoxX/SURF4 family)